MYTATLAAYVRRGETPFGGLTSAKQFHDPLQLLVLRFRGRSEVVVFSILAPGAEHAVPEALLHGEVTDGVAVSVPADEHPLTLRGILGFGHGDDEEHAVVVAARHGVEVEKELRSPVGAALLHAAHLARYLVQFDDYLASAIQEGLREVLLPEQ